MKKNILRHLPHLIIFSAIIISGIIIGGAAYAQQVSSTSTSNITFPIAELGNCTDQVACKAYCDIDANKIACVNYAQSHGLMSSDDTNRAKKFLQAGPGPGGCTDAQTCRSYCSDINHIDECLAYAKKTGILSSSELDEAQKIASALSQGAQLPGGCTTKDQCEDYCKDSSHLTECVAFAEKAGMISQQEADIVRKTGGKGPGGCDSQQSCDAYCNNKDNANTCFAFAQEHGLISQDQIDQMKEGMTRLRAGLTQAPEEVVQCLKDALGSDIIGKIESGNFTPTQSDGQTIQNCFNQFKSQSTQKMLEGFNQVPGAEACIQNKLGTSTLDQIKQGNMPNDPNIGDQIRSCFEENAKEAQQKGLEQIKNALENAPESVKACLQDAIGADGLAKIQQGDSSVLTQDSENKIKLCFSQMQQQGVNQLQSAPAEIQSCLKEQMGSERYGRIISGQGTAEDQKEMPQAIQECTKKYQEQMQNQIQERMQQIPGSGEGLPGMPINGLNVIQNQGGSGTQGMMPPQGQQGITGQQVPSFPSGVKDCLEQVYGSDIVDKIQSGQSQLPADYMQKIGSCMAQKMGAPSGN